MLPSFLCIKKDAHHDLSLHITILGTGSTNNDGNIMIQILFGNMVFKYNSGKVGL